MLHGTASADYLEFIRLNAVLFVEPKVLSMTGGITSADLGSKVAAVRCKLDAANVDPRAPLRDGDASFIESGTAVYAVKGYSPECRVAAKQLGKLTLFLATKPGGEHIAAACPSTAKTP
jgi:hypothetical protein